MKVEITQEQAQHLVALYNQYKVAEVRMTDAVKALAPQIDNAVLQQDGEVWVLTDEAEDVDGPAV